MLTESIFERAKRETAIDEQDAIRTNLFAKQIAEAYSLRLSSRLRSQKIIAPLIFSLALTFGASGALAMGYANIAERSEGSVDPDIEGIVAPALTPSPQKKELLQNPFESIDLAQATRLDIHNRCDFEDSINGPTTGKYRILEVPIERGVYDGVFAVKDMQTGNVAVAELPQVTEKVKGDNGETLINATVKKYAKAYTKDGSRDVLSDVALEPTHDYQVIVVEKTAGKPFAGEASALPKCS